MKVSSIVMTATLVAGMAGVPVTAGALDLGGSVDHASHSVSDATRSVSRSVSRAVGSTTKTVTSATSSPTGGSGGTSGGGSSGGTTGVLSNYQLLSLGLESNPSGTGQGGKVNRTYVEALVSGLDRFERQQLQTRCDSVLRSPKAYDSELILLCQILASI
jgi:hypothetical protein